MSRMAQDTGIATVMLPERVDSATASSVEAKLFSALQPGTRVIIDGSEVVYMSAAGVRTLATVLHRAEEQGARIAFCRFSGPAADCLLVSGFSVLFDVAESVAEASAKLGMKPVVAAEDRLHPRRAAG